jgi:hypothetical protein
MLKRRRLRLKRKSRKKLIREPKYSKKRRQRKLR